MPRNVSGVMSWPAGTTATTNTTISSADYNAFLADLLSDLNAARPIVAGGTGAATKQGAIDGLFDGTTHVDADNLRISDQSDQTKLVDFDLSAITTGTTRTITVPDADVTLGDNTPSGAVMAFAMATAPSGWLECDGSAVSRTTYADLFSALGSLYGDGDGSTTFNLPDFRGRFLRGWDHGAGNDPDAASRTDAGDGSTTGDNVGTKQNDQMQQITGYFTLNRSGASGDGAAFTSTNSAVGSQAASGGGTGDKISFNSANASGARAGTETRPKNINVMYCIKT